MDSILTQLSEELGEKRAQLQHIFDEAGPELKMTDEVVADVQRRNSELEDLQKKFDERRKIADIKQRNRQALDDEDRVVRTLPNGEGKGDMPAQTKSLGQLFTQSPEYKAARQMRSSNFTVAVNADVKTLVSEAGTGFAPQAIRTGVVVPSAQQQPKLVDLIPSTTTDQVAVVFMQETTYTNAAAETAEGGAYQEAALGYSQVTSPVQKIGVILPVTDEQLADVKGMEGRLDNRLMLMLRQRLDNQIMNGNGTAPNLLGFLNTTGILTQARGTDVGVDAILKGITKIRNTGFADPNAIAMNPTDWQNIRLLRTADGVYLFGFPGDPGVQKLWGLPVIESTYVPAGTAVPADYATYTELDYKAGIEFEVSNSHQDYFGKGQLAIRAQFRVALVTYRPAAICSVTGL